MPKEQDPIRDALKQIAESANAPNPLEVLGVTPDLARELQTDALQLAVKGLYRAFQAQLHPDKGTPTEAQTLRLHRIQEAYEQVTNGDVDTFRNQLIRPRRRGRSLNTQEQGIAKELQIMRSHNKEREISFRKSSEYIDGLMSNESIRRIKRGFALIRPISLLKQDNNLPLQALTIDGGHVLLDNLVRTDEYSVPRELAIPKDSVRSDFYVETGRALVRDNDGKLHWQKVDLPNGWHLVRGTGENRTMMSYVMPRQRSRFEMELAGCIDEEAVKEHMNKFFKGSDYKQTKMQQLSSASENAQVPGRFRNRFLIENGWSKYVLNGEEQPGQLVPKLINGQVLTARAGEEHLLILGRVDQTMSHFLGE